jgi:hypothetical protein
MNNVAVRKNQAVRRDNEAGALTAETLAIGTAPQLDCHDRGPDELDGTDDGL